MIVSSIESDVTYKFDELPQIAKCSGSSFPKFLAHCTLSIVGVCGLQDQLLERIRDMICEYVNRFRFERGAVDGLETTKLRVE